MGYFCRVYEADHQYNVNIDINSNSVNVQTSPIN